MMNGVFHSLRGEFDVHETYTGSVVLSVLVSTIKVSKTKTGFLLQKSCMPFTVLWSFDWYSVVRLSMLD